MNAKQIFQLLDSGWTREEIIEIERQAACQAAEAAHYDDDPRDDLESLDRAADRAAHSGGMDIWQNEDGEYCCG